MFARCEASLSIASAGTHNPVLSHTKNCGPSTVPSAAPDELASLSSAQTSPGTKLLLAAVTFANG
jgi:hypothetical protein